MGEVILNSRMFIIFHASIFAGMWLKKVFLWRFRKAQMKVFRSIHTFIFYSQLHSVSGFKIFKFNTTLFLQYFKYMVILFEFFLKGTHLSCAADLPTK